MTTIIDLSTADKMKAAHDAIEAAAAKRLAQPRSLARGQCICRVCGLSEVGRFVKDSKLPGNFECINECENESATRSRFTRRRISTKGCRMRAKLTSTIWKRTPPG